MAIASSRALRACALLCASVSLPTVARAQLAGEVSPPQRASIDENGVNVATGTYRNPHTDLVIGSGPGALAATRIYGDPPYLDAFIDVSGTYTPISVSTSSATYTFAQTSSGWATQGGDGATLVSSVSSYSYYNSNSGSYTNYSYNTYVMTLADGTAYTYNFLVKSRNGSPRSVYLSSIQSPSGLKTTLNWETRDGCNPGNPNPGGACTTNNNVGLLRLGRLDSVSTNAGYQVNYTYQLQNFDSSQSSAVQNTEAVQWQTLASASGSNSQGGSGTLPSVTYAQNTTFPSGSSYNQTNDVTDATGRDTRYTKQQGGGSYEAVRLPGSTNDDLRVNMTDAGIVTSVVRGGQTWTYSYAASGNTSTLTVTDPTNWTRHYTSNLAVGLPTSIVDQFGRTTSYTYDSSNRLATGTSPGGQVTTYTYDINSNVTNTVVTQAGGGATIGTSAAYPANCTGSLSCNLPTTKTDARGNVTSYSYDPTTFALTNLTLPAVNGVTPHTSYGYTQVGGVQVPSSVSTCRTQSSCAGTADEVKTTTSYNANLLPTSVTSGAGDGSLSATTATTYTAAGDVLTVDGPLSGTADTTRYYYDAARRPLGTIGADPDGSGPLLSRAGRANYDSQGRVASQDIGTATGQGDNDLSNMTVSQTTTATFDAVGHAVSNTLSSGGTAYARTEASYDAAGRVVCQTVRMNPSAFTSGTAACTLGTAGSFGQDRITQTTYSSSSPTMSVTSAYGAPEAATESVAYSLTGKVSTVTDANGNVTTYGYDGFDRATTTTYPGGSYEQLGYSANGDLTSRRLRNGSNIAYAYDVLGRLSVKTPPVGCAPQQVGACAPSSATRAVYYGYDLLGHVLSARFDGTGGAEGVSATYDALGRTTSTTSTMGGNGRTLSYVYNLQGNRTQVTHPDGTYFTYSYDLLGEMAHASWTTGATGTVPFVAITYDDLGRRTLINRASSYTGYNWDAASRLINQDQRFVGGAGNMTNGFAYNPSGQMTSKTRDNDDYAFTGAVNVDRSYATNALNQYTSAGPASFTYDANGNLISDGSTSYVYDAENRMVSASGAHTVTLTYDPVGRLFQTAGGSTGTTQFLYDGSQLVGEFDGSNNLLRRYMFGPGDDEPILWDEGTAMNCTGTKFLHTDERGSAVAVADCNGNRLAVNAYDEYGIPNAGNTGRFGYTGQAWLADLGMWFYKARMYSPTLGRFMQTDPIGYGDGLNWYNYVHGDPVNFSDPSGLDHSSSKLPCASNETFVGNGHDGRPICNPYVEGPDIVVNGSSDDIIVIGCGATCQANKDELQRLLGTPYLNAQMMLFGDMMQQMKPCMSTLGNSGSVSYLYTNVGASAGGTASHTIGTFATANGYSGSFSTTAVGINLGSPGASVGVGSGSSRNLDTFSASNYNVGINLGDFNYTRNYTTDSLENIGSSVGLETPSAGVAGTYSFTKLSNVTC